VGGFSSGTEQDVVVQKAEQTIQARPVENAGDSGKPKANSQDKEDLEHRTSLEGGKIIVKTYDGGGQLIKVSPPGYLPPGMKA